MSNLTFTKQFVYKRCTRDVVDEDKGKPTYSFSIFVGFLILVGIIATGVLVTPAIFIVHKINQKQKKKKNNNTPSIEMKHIHSF